jgi:hypothetical protein
LPFRSASLPSFRRSGWPSKPHFPARISKQRHGAVSFLSRLAVPPLFPKAIGPVLARISLPRALSAPPSSPRTRPDRGPNLPVMAPGEVAEWSNAPHSKCGIGASLSGVRIPPSPPISDLSVPKTSVTGGATASVTTSCRTGRKVFCSRLKHAKSERMMLARQSRRRLP